MAQAGANPGGGTYSVQSDIWSLGLTISECAMGRYPYPPETYDNIFSQLSVSPGAYFWFRSWLNMTNRLSLMVNHQISPQTLTAKLLAISSVAVSTRSPSSGLGILCYYDTRGSRP